MKEFHSETMKYEEFDIEDFIADEFFISWIKGNGKEANVFWQSWIAAHPDKLHLIQKAREIILRHQPKRPIPSQKDYTEVLEGILSPHKEKSLVIKQNPKNRRLHYAASITAFFVLLTIGIWFMSNKSSQTEQKAIVATKMFKREIPKGKKSVVTLADGTKVKLNAGASFEFPESFSNSNERRVYLSGEAFFEVAKDTLKPFIIESNHITTTVLGTSFNLQEENGNVAVAVVTGKVKVSSAQENTAVFLNPGEQAEYNYKSKNITKHKIDIESVTFWKDDIIYFHQSAFHEVVDRLENWYGVEFIIERKIKGKFSGRFKSKSLNEVLLGLSYTTDFNFEIEKDKVTIY